MPNMKTSTRVHKIGNQKTLNRVKKNGQRFRYPELSLTGTPNAERQQRENPGTKNDSNMPPFLPPTELFFLLQHASLVKRTKRNGCATGFRCPESSRRGIDTRNSGRLKRWDNLVEVGQSKNKVMQRHENFLSNQEKVIHRNELPYSVRL